MEKFWIIGIVLFSLFVLLFWQITKGPMKKEYGIKMWKQGASRLAYWQGIIYFSLGSTAVILFLLKWGNFVSFDGSI